MSGRVWQAWCWLAVVVGCGGDGRGGMEVALDTSETNDAVSVLDAVETADTGERNDVRADVSEGLPDDVSEENDVSGEAPVGGWLLAFHTCDPSNPSKPCGNPMNHQVQLAWSADGERWELVPGWDAIPGSVPDVIRRGDKAYVITAGGFLTRFDLVSGRALAAVQVRVDGERARFVDPSWALDDEGRLVIVFMDGGPPGADPARCPPGEETCVKVFGSATEIPGSDGEQFLRDSGSRLEVEIGNGQTASDPDVFFDGERWVLYLSKGGVTVYTSKDLRGTYELNESLPNGVLATSGATVPCGERAGTEFWTLGHWNEGGINAIRRARHASIETPLQASDFKPLFDTQALGLGRVNADSPGLAKNQRGR